MFADYKTKLTLVITDSSSGGNVGGDGTYIIVIPDALTMTTSGWTPFEDGISIRTETGKTFSADKKLVISADSENDWQLVLSSDKSEQIGYTLTTASGGSKTVNFTFSAASIDAGVSQDLGVIVADYTKNSAGNYEDTITFTVEVQSALKSLNVEGHTFYYVEGETWRQALTNHPTENAGWQIVANQYIQDKDTEDYIFDDEFNEPGLDTVIDASKQWELS